MNKTTTLILIIIFVCTLSVCSCNRIESDSIAPETQSTKEYGEKPYTVAEITANVDNTSRAISVVYDSDDEDSSWNSSGMTYITLKGNSITLDGTGAVIDGNRIAITSAGTYGITGNLDDGQIIVRVDNKDVVKLILFGVDITCSNNAPIYIDNAKKTVITLADGTKNYITDGDSYFFEDSESDEPNATIFSKDDLTINGNGLLEVNANYDNGIQSKDDLKIMSGNIVVNAVNDGIKGRDSIAIRGGTITINSEGDGMQSTNSEESERGYIAIEGGTLNITAAKDGIQAETSILISDGGITINSGGGSVNSIKTDRRPDNRSNWNMENNIDSADSSPSAKGLKAAIDITITGGSIDIDSSDDSLHSNDSLSVYGGNIVLASGDDGIHSDSSVKINGGDINITKCYEGIESEAIIINDGNIHLISSDDGINVIGENEGFPMGGRPGQDNVTVSGDYYLNINGGYIAINAQGDGIDINGIMNMTGGMLIINGPTANNNGALDSMSCKISGGFLVAAGSAGMPQAPSTSSTQHSVMINLTSLQTANTLFHIETEAGEAILTFLPVKDYQSVVLSSPELKNGTSYIVYTGGDSTGAPTDSLYSAGKYTPGDQNTTFTISSIVTTIGSSGGFPGGPRGDMFPGNR